MLILPSAVSHSTHFTPSYYLRVLCLRTLYHHACGLRCLRTERLRASSPAGYIACGLHCLRTQRLRASMPAGYIACGPLCLRATTPAGFNACGLYILRDWPRAYIHIHLHAVRNLSACHAIVYALICAHSHENPSCAYVRSIKSFSSLFIRLYAHILSHVLS